MMALGSQSCPASGSAIGLLLYRSPGGTLPSSSIAVDAILAILVLRGLCSYSTTLGCRVVPSLVTNADEGEKTTVLALLLTVKPPPKASLPTTPVIIPALGVPLCILWQHPPPTRECRPVRRFQNSCSC
jgi:hypothetical protein